MRSHFLTDNIDNDKKVPQQSVGMAIDTHLLIP